MGISYSPKNAERLQAKMTAHQRRRRERFVDANREAHEDHFGRRREFGKRKFTASGQTVTRRSYGIFKP